jgi:Na+/proline symporter
MSAVIWEDFLKHKYSHRMSDTRATHVNKALVLMFGCLSTGLAFAAGPMGGIIKVLCRKQIASF